MKKEKITFDAFYGSMHKERWPKLKESLLGDITHYPLNENFKKTYFLDKASVIAALALEINEGDYILDMCAAPGGKALVAASRMGLLGKLIANDRSRARRFRLAKVLADHLKKDVFERIRITGHDAAAWGMYHPNTYDRVLLDAPCSSERHVLTSPEHLKKWSPARTRQLSFKQYAMLVSALNAVKPSGKVLYCTCSVSDLENDRVIEKLLKKKGSEFTLEDISSQLGEKTRYGLAIWPDASGGIGPIYIARLRKNPDPPLEKEAYITIMSGRQN